MRLRKPAAAAIALGIAFTGTDYGMVWPREFSKHPETKPDAQAIAKLREKLAR